MWSTGNLSVPQPLLFVRGLFDLDPAAVSVIGTHVVAAVGVSRFFVTVPNNLQLVGTEFAFQNVVVPTDGRFPGLLPSLLGNEKARNREP